MRMRIRPKRQRLGAVWIVLVAATALVGSVAWAGGEEVVVEEVEIEGTERTERYVVEREFTFEVGRPAQREDIEETGRRLRNLPMFDRVEYELEPIDETSARLHIEVDEQWTLLPTANFRITDDVRVVRLGGRDINIVGRFLEAGAVYEWRSGVHSGEGWFRNPRLFGRRLDLGVEGAYRNRIFRLFDDDGELEGGFSSRRIVGEVDIDGELLRWLRLGGRLEVTDDVPGLRAVDDDIRRAQRGRELPPSTTLIRPGVTAQVGRIDDDGFLADGVTWTVRVDGASEQLGSTDSFIAVDSEMEFARSLPQRSLLVSRGSVAATGAQAEYHRLFAGGLDEVRGFRDMRFRGNYRWFANLEYRIPSVNTEWVVIQHAVFGDAASVGDEFSALASVDAVSVGAGIRVKTPKIHSLVLRLDYAFSLHGDGRAPLSLGGNQFL